MKELLQVILPLLWILAPFGIWVMIDEGIKRLHKNTIGESGFPLLIDGIILAILWIFTLVLIAY